MTAFNDLRGVGFREVGHTDAVVITGEEYIRKSEAADAMERLVPAVGSALGYLSADAEEGDEQAMAIVMQLRDALDD